MAADRNQISTRRFMFNLDILIEDETNGRALEKLLHLMNESDIIADYRIQSGVELGGLIQEALHESADKLPIDIEQPAGLHKEKPTRARPTSTASSPDEQDSHREIWEQFQKFKQSNALVRLTIVKSMGVKLSVPCRILNVDPPSGNVSVYHVDEKQVYLFKINEIDDFAVS
ncbi:hypothetical protein [Paenibacillus rigui]|uniref:Uncharacterized protein n=1 Tax=Paenibacillus rigui TaxID=554312 RepID=A0A229ULE4_9BACL|nr:hypothetical protein [Paenibacillus rigui]OXM84202.1 hypothetical protein CF651_20665 [Paenibacillus rigui]